MSKSIIVVMVMLGLSACVNDKVVPAASDSTVSKPAVSTPSGASTVKVYKFKKSVSCDQSSGVSLADMHEELTKADIKVKAALCGRDGIARAAVCGTETGYVNVYEVSVNDEPKAKALGFKSLVSLNGFSQIGCGI